MKKLIAILCLTVTLTACEGDQGPQGLPGINADEYAALSYEVDNIDFEYFNDTGLQEAIVPLPYDILGSDVVLVYRLEGIVDIDGQPTETWSPLPQNFFISDTDTIQYIFNHTYADVQLLIDGNFDLSTLAASYTQNQVFRIVILPADALSKTNTSNLNSVINTYNIKEFLKL